MKRLSKLFCLLVTLVLLCMALIPTATVMGSSLALLTVTDDFSGSQINSKNWSVSGQNIGVSDTDGALKIEPRQGYSHSVLFKAMQFEHGKTYSIEFDASAKFSGEVWLGLVIGATGVGATYEKKCSNAVIISADKTQSRVDSYAVGVFQQEERVYFDEWNNSGKYATFKYEFTPDGNEYALKLYAKDTGATAEFGEAKGTFKISSIAGYIALQANGDGAIVKIKNFKVFEGETLVESEDFSLPTKELLNMTDNIDDARWVAQNENYSTGLEKALKFTDSQNAKLISKTEITKDDGNIEIFDLTIGFGINSVTDGNGFGVDFGYDTEDQYSIYFEKNGDAYKLIGKKANDETVIADSVSLTGNDTLRLVGKYDDSIEVYLMGNYVGKVETPFTGKFAISTFGTASVSLSEVNLLQYSFVKATGEKTSSNFNAKANGSTTKGWLDKTKWRIEGGCSLRNGVLKFQSGDIYTSFNTVDKYQDFILRFDVVKITAAYIRDEDGLYSVPGYYKDMSIGVSLGKKSYDESSVSGEHPAMLFCTKYFNKNSEGKFIPNMIVWGYGIQTESGGSSAWPNECWWHDGSDQKLVTATDGLKINVMIVAKNRTVKVYYKYSNQPESYLDTPKAEFVNVNTYGHVAISCGYNSTFEIDNISIVPLSFENYL